MRQRNRLSQVRKGSRQQLGIYEAESYPMAWPFLRSEREHAPAEMVPSRPKPPQTGHLMVGRLSVERSFNFDVRIRKFKGLNARRPDAHAPYEKSSRRSNYQNQLSAEW